MGAKGLRRVLAGIVRTLTFVLGYRAQHLQWARSLVIYTSTMLRLSPSSVPMLLHIHNVSVPYLGMGIF